jgi:PAS domain S-box-containing protein
MKVFSSFRRTILLSLAGLMGIVSLLALSLSNAYQNANQHARIEVENITQVLEEDALATVQKVDLLLREIQRNIRPDDIQVTRGVSGSRKKELQTLLKSQVDSVPEVAALHITNARGEYIYSSLDSPPGVHINIADRDYFKHQRNNVSAGLVISHPLVSRSTGKWTIILSRRLNFKNGSFAGVALVVLNIEYFQQFYRTLNLGSHGLVALYDKELHLAARYPSVEAELGKIANLHAKTYIEKGIKQALYQATSPVDGVERLYGYHQVGDLPLFVFAGLSEEDYLAEWRNFSIKAIELVTLFILVTSSAVLLIYRGEKQRSSIVKALQDLNRDFLTLLESTTDFIYFKDKDSRILFCSQTLADITGHSSWRELIGKHDSEIFPENIARIYSEEELPVFRDGQPILNRVDPYYDEAGKQGWVSTNKWPVFDNEGKNVVGLFGISRNITEFKQAEIALRESEQRFRNMFHKHSSIMLLVDPNRGEIVDANLAAANFYGYSEDTLRSMRIDQINTLPEKEIQIEWQLALQEKRNHFVFPHRLANGEIRTVEVYSTPIDDSGKELLFSIVYDITERKKAEDALQSSNNDLARFAYSVSHDMRQPLRAVSGHLQLLQRSLKDKLDENERENLGFALEGALRMDSMIVSLLEYSRVGRKTESKQWIASRVSLDEALGFLAPLIGETKAEIALSGEWPQVFASRDELIRLFQNLIGNAIKFRETGQPALVEIDSSVHCNTWRVSVRDHGVGINPKQTDRLFQFFSRLQSRTRFEGTGMGLALCKRIVEHHGGRIWVESAGEGKGSTFIFELGLPSGTGRKSNAADVAAC